jgi:hypothetical protein
MSWSITPSLGFTDVHAAIITGLAFTPDVHLNYPETVQPMKDGLPKLKDSEIGRRLAAAPEVVA